MSYEEPTPFELPPGKFVPASVVMEFTQGSYVNTEDELQDKIQFTWSDIEQLAVAMNTQGSFFMGHDVRTHETSWTVARDLLVILNLMGYNLQPVPNREVLGPTLNEEGPEPFVRQVGGDRMFRSTSGVTGQAGNSR